jgi:hypothetical protein
MYRQRIAGWRQSDGIVLRSTDIRMDSLLPCFSLQVTQCSLYSKLTGKREVHTSAAEATLTIK